MIRNALQNMCAVAVIGVIPAVACADPAGDEARRQASMARAANEAAAIDRRNADQAFQQGLARSTFSPSGSGSSSSSGSASSGTSSSGPGARANESAYSGAANEGFDPATGRGTIIIRGNVTAESIRESLRNVTVPDYAEAALRLSREAAAGNAQSQYLYGRMQYSGYGMPSNHVEARKLFLAAANQGHVEASTYAGQFLVYGKGGPVDRSRGLELLSVGALAGNTEAQAVLGVQYMMATIETGNNANMPRAVNYLEQAAANGSAIAQSTLGTLIYYYGVGGIAQDGIKAVKFMRMGAEQGEPMSMYHLGNLMLNGDEWTGENRTEGWSLVSRAAQLGDGRAMWLLAAAKYFGTRGQTKNEAEAVRLMQQGAKTGERNAQFGWAMMLYQGVLGRPADKVEGLRYARLSADQSNPEAMCFIGKSYYFGDEGMAKNLEEAARWAKLAAESGYPEGQLFYGQLLWSGEGVAQDKVASVRWKQKAAKQGNPTAVEDLKDPEVVAILKNLPR